MVIIVRKLVFLFGSLFVLASIATAQSNTKLKICYNGVRDKLFASTQCLGTSSRFNLNDFVASGQSQLVSGTTVYGVIGGRYHGNSSAAFAALASLPAPAPQIFDGEDDIQVANTAAVDDDCGGGTCLTAEENDVAARCAGTPEDPTAPAGIVCIYPTQRLNAEFLVGFNIVNGSNGNTPSPGVFGSGFGLGWEATGDDDDDLDSAVLAVWAYTAP